MADGSLPPQVDGPILGRLDVIFGRPAIFPQPLPSQTFIFTFRWWGDTRPCILRLPPEKGEGRITHTITCNSESFRQYLIDMKTLQVNVRLSTGHSFDEHPDSFIHQIQSPRRNEGDTPRQKLLRRQLRLKKGWQDGDTIGTFTLSDIKLNTRGDYVCEGRILDSSADVIGTVVVTMVYTDAALDYIPQLNLHNIGQNSHNTDQTQYRINGSDRQNSHSVGQNSHIDQTQHRINGSDRQNLYSTGQYSHSIGENSHSTGQNSHTIGQNSHTIGQNSHNTETTQHRQNSHIGQNSHTIGQNSHSIDETQDNSSSQDTKSKLRSSGIPILDPRGGRSSSPGQKHEPHRPRSHSASFRESFRQKFDKLRCHKLQNHLKSEEIPKNTQQNNLKHQNHLKSEEIPKNTQQNNLKHQNHLKSEEIPKNTQQNNLKQPQNHLKSEEIPRHTQHNNLKQPQNHLKPEEFPRQSQNHLKSEEFPKQLRNNLKSGDKPQQNHLKSEEIPRHTQQNNLRSGDRQQQNHLKSEEFPKQSDKLRSPKHTQQNRLYKSEEFPKQTQQNQVYKCEEKENYAPHRRRTGSFTKVLGDGIRNQQKHEEGTQQKYEQRTPQKYEKQGSSQKHEQGMQQKYEQQGTPQKYEQGVSQKHEQGTLQKYERQGIPQKYERQGMPQKYERQGIPQKYEKQGASQRYIPNHIQKHTHISAHRESDGLQREYEGDSSQYEEDQSLYEEYERSPREYDGLQRFNESPRQYDGLQRRYEGSQTLHGSPRQCEGLQRPSQIPHRNEYPPTHPQKNLDYPPTHPQKNLDYPLTHPQKTWEYLSQPQRDPQTDTQKYQTQPQKTQEYPQRDPQTDTHKSQSHADSQTDRHSYQNHRELFPPQARVSPRGKDDGSEVLMRRDTRRDGDKDRPASWSLYPLLDGADPRDFVESGAIEPEELPVLLQVLEGQSPIFDMHSQQLLNTLDERRGGERAEGSSEEEGKYRRERREEEGRYRRGGESSEEEGGRYRRERLTESSEDEGSRYRRERRERGESSDERGRYERERKERRERGKREEEEEGRYNRERRERGESSEEEGGRYKRERGERIMDRRRVEDSGRRSRSPYSLMRRGDEATDLSSISMSGVWPLENDGGLEMSRFNTIPPHVHGSPKFGSPRRLQKQQKQQKLSQQQQFQSSQQQNQSSQQQTQSQHKQQTQNQSRQPQNQKNIPPNQKQLLQNQKTPQQNQKSLPQKQTQQENGVTRMPSLRGKNRTYQTFPGRSGASERKGGSLLEAWGCEKGVVSEKAGKNAEDDGSVLVIDVGTLTLISDLMPQLTERDKKVSGVKVLHRSRICYLTSIDVQLPYNVPMSPDCPTSHTCTSRQVTHDQVNYNQREVLPLPQATAMQVLRGHLVIRSVCRRLGERESEEVGSAKVSLLDLWQYNGSKVQINLYNTHRKSERDEKGKRDEEEGRGKGWERGRGRTDEIYDQESKTDELKASAKLSFTARLALSMKSPELTDSDNERWSSYETAQKKDTTESSREPQPVILPSERLYRDGEGTEFSERSYHGEDDRAEGSDKLYHGEGKRAEQSEKFYCGEGESTEPNDRLYRERHEVVPLSRDHYLGHTVSYDDPNLSSNLFLQPQSNLRLVRGQPQVYPGQIEVVELSDGKMGSYGAYQGLLFNGTNKPVESGGESPCIQTVTDYCTDFINYDNLGFKRDGWSDWDVSRDGSCRVHLEIIKGRNLPWIEGPDRKPVPPNTYVRTNVGHLSVLTNVCMESVNPIWGFAADVILPYSQLSETKGSLILKVHHRVMKEAGSRQDGSRPDDPLLGFVSVDATSIWGGHVSLCGWYPLLDLSGALRGHLKVSLTPHEPPHPITPSTLWQPISLRQHYQPSSPYTRHSYPQYHQQTSDTSLPSAVARSFNVIPQLPTKSERPDAKEGHTTEGRHGNEQQGHGNEQQGHGNEQQGQGYEQRGHRNEQQGHGNEQQGHGNEQRGHGNEQRGDGNEQRGHGNEQQGHGNEQRGHGNEQRGHGNEQRGHGNEQRGHGNEQRGHGNEQRRHGNEQQGYEQKYYENEQRGYENTEHDGSDQGRFQSGVSHQSSVQSGVSHQNSVQSGASHQSSFQSGVSHQSSVQSGVSHQSSFQSGGSHQDNIQSGVSQNFLSCIESVCPQGMYREQGIVRSPVPQQGSIDGVTLDNKTILTTVPSSYIKSPNVIRSKSFDDNTETNYQKRTSSIPVFSARIRDDTKSGTQNNTQIPIHVRQKSTTQDIHTEIPTHHQKSATQIPTHHQKSATQIPTHVGQKSTTQDIHTEIPTPCQKGVIIVKGLTTQRSSQPQPVSKDTINSSKQQQVPEKDESILIKDSIIINHFRLQNQNENISRNILTGSEKQSDLNKSPDEMLRDLNKSSVSQRQSDLNKGPEQEMLRDLNKGNEERLRDLNRGSVEMAASNKSSVAEEKSMECRAAVAPTVKASSCLKVPGSPSLRAKRVTFAHKLVHHQETSSGENVRSHITNWAGMAGSGQAEGVHTARTDSLQRDIGSEGLGHTEQAGRIAFSLHRDAGWSKESVEISNTHTRSGFGVASDLQVVPCREGDMQVNSHHSNSANTHCTSHSDISPQSISHQNSANTHNVDSHTRSYTSHSDQISTQSHSSHQNSANTHSASSHISHSSPRNEQDSTHQNSANTHNVIPHTSSYTSHNDQISIQSHIEQDSNHQNSANTHNEESQSNVNSIFASPGTNSSDLIMAFSWMTQSQSCDTPCVSFIESKSMQNNDPVSELSQCTGDNKSPVDVKGVLSSPKRSRKLRSRLAANLPPLN